jgi:hypothetical protein
MNPKLFTAMLTVFFITGCNSIPEDYQPEESSNSVEREDEILRQRLTIKKQPDKSFNQQETPLNDNVIEEDLIINTVLKDKDKDKDTQKSKVENSTKGAEKDDPELDDEIDHDAIDIDYREKKKKPSSDKNSDN